MDSAKDSADFLNIDLVIGGSESIDKLKVRSNKATMD